MAEEELKQEAQEIVVTPPEEPAEEHEAKGEAPALDDEPSRGRAALACRADRAEEHRRDDEVEIGVLEDEDVPGRPRRRDVGPAYQLARLVDGVGDRLGHDVLDVDVRGVPHRRAFLAGAAAALWADQGCGKGNCCR